MIDQKRKLTTGLLASALLLLFFAIAVNGLAADAHNVRLLGHSDLQGRPALQVVLKGDFAYVGHHSGSATNPLSGKMESNGTSIVDVSNPSQPKIIHHIPGYPGSESRAVQVVENFFNGRDFILRNQESGLRVIVQGRHEEAIGPTLEQLQTSLFYIGLAALACMLVVWILLWGIGARAMSGAGPRPLGSMGQTPAPVPAETIPMVGRRA